MGGDGMRIEATFSKGLAQALNGRAVGDEFTLEARARIVGADEVLLDVSEMGNEETEVIQGDLQVRLLLSHPRVIA
jgi:hypothetical protein